MKKLIAVALLTLAGLLSTATPASAQLVGLSDIVTSLEPCNANMENRVAYVTDAENATTLGAGGGSAKVWVRCESGTWSVQPAVGGDFIPTSGFIYFCIATDTWQRVAIATWP